jgi:RHS repeat-associated protein
MNVNGSKVYDDNGTEKTITETTDYDGWGRVIHQVDANGGQVNTNYDHVGRVVSKTNPFTAGGSPSYSTSYSYDVLGRLTTVTLPDSQPVTTTYSGPSVTLTDQVNRKMQRVADGLGRLVTVYEQDSSGNLTQATNYTYDYLDSLTQVDQGGQLRKYKYDALSRLLYEKIPEQTASINDGTGTYWTSKFTYTDYDKISTRTDARGVVTSYSYDSLHRLTQIGYNTVSGVTTAPSVYHDYDYDGTYSITNEGQLVRTSLYGSSISYEEYYTVDSFKRPTSTIRKVYTPGQSTRTYTTSYSLNEGGQLTQLTYPSALTIAVTHDTTGRVSGLQNTSTQVNYLSSVSYNIGGQVTGDTLGNGVTEQFGYDAARMQMTSQKAGTSSPYTNRMDLTYSYSATSGQMGVGSTAGNAGQLMSVSGTINSTTESASYTYDNYKRLVTSNQSSNGSSAQRRFVHDRWANRTGVWDATSGGNQIQSIALQGSGGIPTNQIASVTAGSTLNYSHDAAGNVTNDGVHSYAYDSENRIVSVDGGSTASYAYDHKNRRYKKTIGSTATHYVWQGGQVIAEHNGGTGAAVVEYISSRRRMLAEVVSGNTSYFLIDRLSLRLAMNTSGNVVGRQGHLPFGEDFGGSGAQEKHHLTSYERDTDTNTDYAVNRQYSQSTGRFSRVDPVSVSMMTPQSLNRYAYVHNDPINLRDPLGLFCPGGTFYNPETSDCEDFEGDPTNPFPGQDFNGNRGEGIEIVDPTPTEIEELVGEDTIETCDNLLRDGVKDTMGDGYLSFFSDTSRLTTILNRALQAAQSRVSAQLILTVWWFENNFNIGSRTDLAEPVYGPMQLKASTANDLGLEASYVDLALGGRSATFPNNEANITANLTVGAIYLQYLMERFIKSNDPILAATAYQFPVAVRDSVNGANLTPEAKFRYKQMQRFYPLFRDWVACRRRVTNNFSR